jgi:predicted  nucleic acid-binding Zn-ribbon protein
VNLTDNRLSEVKKAIKETQKRIKKMTISQAQFDTDLAAAVTAFTSLITAVDAYIASKPAADLTTEDNTLKTAAANATAEIAKLNPSAKKK